MNNRIEKCNIKNESGITMIALIITIIILGVLAVVSINMIGGNDGIIQRAKKTKEEAQAASANEVNEVSKFNETVNSYDSGIAEEANAVISPEGSEMVSSVVSITDRFMNYLENAVGIKSFSVDVSKERVVGSVDLIYPYNSNNYFAKNSFQNEGSGDYSFNGSNDKFSIFLISRTALKDDYYVGKRTFDKTLKDMDEFKVIEYSEDVRGNTYYDRVTSATVKYNNVYYKVKMTSFYDSSTGKKMSCNVTEATPAEIAAAAVTYNDDYTKFYSGVTISN